MKKKRHPRRGLKPRPGGKRAAAARQETCALLGTAVRLLQVGQLSRARSLFEQVLEREPRNADALQFYGLLCFECGEVDRARELIESAIAENSRVAPYYDNLGKVLESQGDLEQALSAFIKANKLEPGVADRNFNMGVVLQRMGRLDDAERQLRQAIDSQPNDADYLFNLGVVLKAQGRYDEAVSAYQDALSRKPQSSNIKNNLGNALLLSGDAPGAAEVLRQAASRSPGNAHIHNNLGNALRETGDLDGAVKSYRRALEIDSSFIDVHNNLGNALLYSGRLEEAARVLLRGLNLWPDSPEFRRGFVSAVRHLEIRAHDPALEAAIVSCMSADDVHAQDLARVAAGQLRARHDLDSAGTGSPEAAALALAGDEQALRLLEKTINVDPVFEGVLVDIRRWLLGLAGGVISDSLFRLACALAQQCFSNEFVFEEDVSETQAVDTCANDLQAALCSKEFDDARLFSLILGIALYRPLYLLDSAGALAKRSQTHTWPDPMRALLERALIGPRQQARMGTRIPCLKPISDPTSLAVKNQYEHHPYPRWLDLPRREQRTYGDFLQRTFVHFKPPALLNGPVRVLVAGCGTGSEALAVARNRICARVVAVDLSRTSLAYALAMSEKLEVENVEFLQADVLDLPSAGDRYEVVESSGVLHHLADPIAGWKALSECLLPGGVMKLGLYSESARRTVVKARELIREWNLSADIEGIRRIRSRIMRAGAEDPLRELRESEDLYTTSACRDLLFHVCEHRFTLDKIRGRLDELGFRFIGFELPFSFMQHRFRLLNPGNPNMQDLDAWARVEARYPDTFAAMYVFWCQKPK